MRRGYQLQTASACRFARQLLKDALTGPFRTEDLDEQEQCLLAFARQFEVGRAQLSGVPRRDAVKGQGRHHFSLPQAAFILNTGELHW